MDWFQKWPKEALVEVAEHFLADFQVRTIHYYLFKNDVLAASGFIIACTHLSQSVVDARIDYAGSIPG